MTKNRYPYFIALAAFLIIIGLWLAVALVGTDCNSTYENNCSNPVERELRGIR